MINYKHLHYFWAAAKQGGIARASEHLHLTPQTISGQISLLEDYLEEELFTKAGRNLELTEIGRLVLGYADEIFSLGGEMEEAVRNLPSGKSMVFKVGVADVVPKSIAYRLIAPAMKLSELVRIVCREKEVKIKTKEGNVFSLKAETVLLSLGRGPNTNGLGLEDIGVEYNRRGIKVDNRLRTNHKHIYAAGDINGGFQFTHAAGYEGGIVLSNAIFHLPRKVDYTFMPWCTYTDPPLGSIGMNEKSAKAGGINYTVWTEEFKDNDRSLAEGESIGRIKMILNEKEKPIGVQILGPHAGDLLAEWVAVLNGKVKLSTLAAAVHPYPTIGEINKKVAGTFFSPKIFSKKVQKGLKFFFQLKGRACAEDSCSE